MFPDYVTVYLNYLPALRASAEDGSLSGLNAAYDNALEVENTISRRALNRGK